MSRKRSAKSLQEEASSEFSSATPPPAKKRKTDKDKVIDSNQDVKQSDQSDRLEIIVCYVDGTRAYAGQMNALRAQINTEDKAVRVEFVDSIDYTCDVCLASTTQKQKSVLRMKRIQSTRSTGRLTLGITSKIIEAISHNIPIVSELWIFNSSDRGVWLQPNQFNMEILGKIRTNPTKPDSWSGSRILSNVQVYVQDRGDILPTKASLVGLLRKIGATIVEFAQGYTF